MNFRLRMGIDILNSLEKILGIEIGCQLFMSSLEPAFGIKVF